MKGQAHWIDLVVILLGALLIFGGVLLATARWALQRVRKRLTCPVKGETVDVLLVKDKATNVYVDVTSCSAFRNPRDVRCAQTCRRDLNLARAVTVLCLASLAFGCGETDPTVRRTYFIAADEIAWDYAPGGNLAGDTFDEHAAVFLENVPWVPDIGMEVTAARVGSRYLKALYREYTDESFATLKGVPTEWTHLGTLGPTIRAEVGDEIVVVFKNNTRFPYGIHAHGVLYDKASEGADYPDGSAMDGDVVEPGETWTYVWQVPERAGPGPDQPSSILWMYHSHVDETDDTYAGLIGPILVTRRGEGRADGSPRDVDRELVNLFHVYNENLSQYLAANVATYANMDDRELMPELADDEGFHESNLKHSINGWLYANAQGITMRKGERVRWYLYAMGTEVDLHTPHWHGTTILANGMRSDMVDLLPSTMLVADMVPDVAGTWLYHCHVNDHLDAGMIATFTVEP
jgi:FtsP/CotA-like multicopper oxidase with cupredoxin domain